MYPIIQHNSLFDKNVIKISLTHLFIFIVHQNTHGITVRHCQNNTSCHIEFKLNNNNDNQYIKLRSFLRVVTPRYAHIHKSIISHSLPSQAPAFQGMEKTMNQSLLTTQYHPQLHQGLATEVVYLCCMITDLFRTSDLISLSKMLQCCVRIFQKSCIHTCMKALTCGCVPSGIGQGRAE